MKLYYLVVVTVDTAELTAANPPEDLRGAIRDEMQAHLDDSSVYEALGIIKTEVRPIATLGGD